jgi:hypothetical protein
MHVVGKTPLPATRREKHGGIIIMPEMKEIQVSDS